MRKFSIVVMMIMILAISAVANAEIMGRKVFAMNGEFIEFIPFSFTVPSGCGNIKTFEFIQSSNFPIQAPAYWQELTPGQQTESYSLGIFKFQVDAGACSPELVIEGQLNDHNIYGIWSGIEQDPEDLGILMKNSELVTNYFGLSADDSQYSYVLAFSPFGRKYTLDNLAIAVNIGNAGIQPAGSELVGIIIPNERGYLSKIIADKKGKKKTVISLETQAKQIIMHDDQFVVLIYKENY